MAPYVNEAIQHLELLLRPEETLNMENFDVKVGAALNGRLGAFYQLYLFAITSVHTTTLPSEVFSFKYITDTFKSEAIGIYSHAQQSQQMDSYCIQTTRFAVPKRREAIEYMLDVLRNIDHLTEAFPPLEISYNSNIHKEMAQLDLKNHFIGMRSKPRPVLTVFRILLAAELLQHFSTVSPANGDTFMDDVVKWWWGEDGEFPENFPNFDSRLNRVTDGYPGVFGTLLHNLGDTQPIQNPRSRGDPRRIYQYLTHRSQIQPWMSKLRSSMANPTFHHRGPSAIGNIGGAASESLGTITENLQDSTKPNPPRSTGTYCLPEHFSTTSESSQEGETKTAAPAENVAPADAPSRSTNTFSVPDKNIESSDSSDSADHDAHPTTASPAKETTTSTTEQIATATSTSNVPPATEETLVAPDKDSNVPMSTSAIQNTPDESNHGQDNDTAVSRTNTSDKSWSPSNQLHEFVQDQSVDIPANSPPTSQEPPPQETPAATGFEISAAHPERSSPPTLRRSERQRRQPQRYVSTPTRQRQAINSEPENSKKVKDENKKSTPKSKTKRQEKDKRKSADLERVPTKRRKRVAKGGTTRRKNPAHRPPPAGASASETACVSARGRMRKVPRKYGP